ncbi:MAG: hypothetical protein V3V01_18450, partial [Acidimicrobiales bacterium]
KSTKSTKSFAQLLELFLAEPHDEPFVFGLADNNDSPEPAIEVAVTALPPSDDPLLPLVGFDAPAHWQATGVVAAATAHSPNGSSKVLIATLVDRRGSVVARLRNDDGEVLTMPSQGEGRLPDLCRRTLGVPCPAPSEASTSHLFTTMWLSAILEHVLDQPLEKRSTWSEIEVLHPAAQLLSNSLDSLVDRANTLARQVNWEQLRLLCADDEIVIADIEPSDAAWFDEGSFSRWAPSVLPWMGELAGDVGELLCDDVGKQLADVLEALLAPSNS